MDSSVGFTVNAMVASILVASCGILFDFLEHVPATIAHWQFEAALILWGIVTVFAVGMAATGLPTLGM